MKTLNNDDEQSSWLGRIKNFLQTEPQNKDELITLLKDAHGRELIDTESFNMIENIIHFNQLRVRDLMLAKSQMTCLSIDHDLAAMIQIINQSGHSRFPVMNQDEIIGILHAKDLLRFYHQQPSEINVRDLIRTATFIPESKRIDLLLREFRNSRNHMALVVDEYGIVSGFITIEDIIEQIIGNIEDEFDVDEEMYIKSQGDHYYIVKAHTPIDFFNEQLNANFSDLDYDTIGGIVMTHCGHMPKRGALITIGQFEFKVINADSRRLKLLGCWDKRNSQGQHHE